jgi:hypothetical protein
MGCSVSRNACMQTQRTAIHGIPRRAGPWNLARKATPQHRGSSQSYRDAVSASQLGADECLASTAQVQALSMQLRGCALH